MANNTTIGDISHAISDELKVYSSQVVESVKKVAKTEATKLVKKTKETAPVGERKKHYRNQIASRKKYENDRAIVYQWYVKGSDYRLSHLLENGHALRDGGRVEGTHFIANAYKPIEQEYIKKIEEAIKNG